MDLKDRAAALNAEAARIRSEMGGADKIARSHDKGRLTIRERIDRLLDDGTPLTSDRSHS